MSYFAESPYSQCEARSLRRVTYTATVSPCCCIQVLNRNLCMMMEGCGWCWSWTNLTSSSNVFDVKLSGDTSIFSSLYMVVPTHIENSSFLEGGGDATRHDVMRQLLGEGVPIVGYPTELGSSDMERCYGNPALSTICCDLASGPTNNVELTVLTRSQTSYWTTVKVVLNSTTELD